MQFHYFGGDTVVVAPLGRVLNRNLPGLHQVRLRSNDDEGKVLAVVEVDLKQKLALPHPQTAERLAVRRIVHKNARVGSSVKAPTQTLKPLLSRCIPELWRIRFRG